MNIEIQDGAVYRDGGHIGTIEGETCFLFDKQPPAVKGAINKAHGSKLAFEVTRDPPTTPDETETINSGQESADGTIVHVLDESKSGPTEAEVRAFLEERGLAVAPIEDPNSVLVTTPAVPARVSSIEVLRKLAAAGKIPAPPATDPALGSRTPEFVEWVRENTTADEFARIYENRRLPSWDEYKDELARKRGAKLRGEIRTENDKPALM